MANLQKIRTGCVSIDQMLEGGLSAESVSLIYGEAETGKTTLAMQCAVSCAQQGYKTLFVDCDGSFSVLRLSQITSERFEEIAKTIILMRPTDFREQSTVVDSLEDYVTKKSGLVVVDTLTSLYRLRVAEHPNKAFDFNRELNRQAAVLAQFSRVNRIAVLLTSQVRSVFNSDTVSVEPVGTRVMKFWADTIICLKPTEAPSVIQAVMEKNTKDTQSHTFDLKIDETGIHDCINL